MSENPGSSPDATLLEFNSAMTNFKIMFPDMDGDVIEAVLRANEGGVDTTIDQLLGMAADIEGGIMGAEAGQDRSPPPAYQNNLPSYQQAVTGSEEQERSKRSDSYGYPPFPDDLESLGAAGGAAAFPVESNMGDTTPLHRLRGWKPPLLGSLPHDFLRIPAPVDCGVRQGRAYTHPDRPSHQQQQQAEIHKIQAARSANMNISHQMLKDRYAENQKCSLSIDKTPETTQFLEDERIALMLQNEEFMAELRGNQEFMSTLNLEESFHESVGEQPMPLEERKTSNPMEDVIFREKLKKMSKISKQKFAKLAKMFARRQKMFRRDGLPGTSKDNLLVNEDSDSDEKR